jgi:F-type H+-transporting ATPase subunit b
MRRLAVAAAALAAVPSLARAEGMPQLDFANPLVTSQVVWMALIFLVLYLLLSRMALPQVTQVLEDRAARIAGDLDAARSAKTQADAAVREVTEATAKARAEAQAAINSAMDEAKAAAAAQSAQLAARLDAQLAQAEQSIGAARASAMSALREVASDTATSVVTRLTGQAPDHAMLDAAVGHALAARGQG